MRGRLRRRRKLVEGKLANQPTCNGQKSFGGGGGGGCILEEILSLARRRRPRYRRCNKTRGRLAGIPADRAYHYDTGT